MNDHITIRSSIDVFLRRAVWVGTLHGILKSYARWRVAWGRNLVTTIGSEHYAELLARGEPPNSFEAMVLGTGSATPAVGDTLSAITQVAGSLKLLDAGYPKADDDDTGNANRGSKRVTYRCTYGLSEANATGITRVAVTNFKGGSPATAEPLLLHGSIVSFNKTASDELIVYVNHEIGN